MTPALLAEIHDRADGFRRNVRKDLGVELAFNREGVAWLDGFIGRAHARKVRQHENDGLVTTLGCVLGQCLVESLGGTWVETANGVGVALPSSAVEVYPFAKVRKQLENGAEDSVLSLFNVVAAMEDPRRGDIS